MIAPIVAGKTHIYQTVSYGLIGTRRLVILLVRIFYTNPFYMNFFDFSLSCE